MRANGTAQRLAIGEDKLVVRKLIAQSQQPHQNFSAGSEPSAAGRDIGERLRTARPPKERATSAPHLSFVVFSDELYIVRNLDGRRGLQGII
jgi:hypothetical protein